MGTDEAEIQYKMLSEKIQDGCHIITGKQKVNFFFSSPSDE